MPFKKSGATPFWITVDAKPSSPCSLFSKLFLIQPLLALYVCVSNWNIVWNSLTEGIFIRCHLVLNKCGLWCSLISACSTCSVWALFAGSVPQRLLKEPLHLCQGQVEICCTLLIGQSAFQTRSHHTQIRLSYRPGVNRGFSPPPCPSCSLCHPLVDFQIFPVMCCFLNSLPPRVSRRKAWFTD